MDHMEVATVAQQDAVAYVVLPALRAVSNPVEVEIR
jgi:hypothetical protein